MYERTWKYLRRVMDAGEERDARAHKALSQVAATIEESKRVVVKLSRQGERSARHRKIYAEFCTADATVPVAALIRCSVLKR